MRPILIALLLLAAPPAHAERMADDMHDDPAQESQLHPNDFRPLPLHQAARIVGERYRGRLIGARLGAPTPHERELGVELVMELRLITPARNLLVIRLDARSGRFLDVAGVGQIEALKR